MSLHLLLPAVLLSAKLLEELARRVRLPAVVGAILAGVALGPSMLGVIPAEAEDPDGFELVQALAQIGLCVLLFRIGLDTRLREFRPVWRAASLVAVVGMILPLLLGWAVGRLWGWPSPTALFLGATLSATSIGVTASVLGELHAQRSTEGLVILGAAVLDDVLGLVLLSGLVAALTPSQSVTGQIVHSLGQAVVFIVAGIAIGPYIAGAAVAVSRWAKDTTVLLVMAFSYFLLLAYAARVVGLEMIIGAYAAGLAFSGHSERDRLDRDLKPLLEILTPLFFVLVGASVRLSGLSVLSPAGRRVWVFVLALFAAAAVSKLLSAVPVRGPVNRWAIGSGMVPRGEVGLVFAQIGLTAGLFSTELFSSVVVVLIATTLVGPILLRVWWKGDAPQMLGPV